MNGASDADQKPLYCHWDTHVDDVLFTNEADLDRHIYGHFTQSSDDTNYLAPTPASPPRPADVPVPSAQTIECHWDACHEMFEIDQIMQHLRESHMQGSLYPHLQGCDTGTQHCGLPSPKSEPTGQIIEPAFVRLNGHESEPPVADGTTEIPRGLSGIDPESLPQLQAGGVPRLSDLHTCEWCLPNGKCCGERFITSPELRAHIVHNHVMDQPASKCSCSWKDCPRDGKPFGQRQKLIRHLQTHAKTFDFKCRVCGRPLSCESMRRLHERSHSNEKPFKCGICGSRFRANSSLIVHQRTHTGEKPLKCKFPGCNKYFSESSNLAKHMRTHLERAFECDVCHRKFTRKDHLIRHYRSRCGQLREQASQRSGANGVPAPEHVAHLAGGSTEVPPPFMYVLPNSAAHE